MDRTRLEAIREDLDQLRRRFARGEIDEPTYDRFKEKLLADLTAEERAALGVSATPAPQLVSGVSPRTGTPTPVGPSGGSGRGLRTSIPSLADLDLRPGSILLGQWKLIKELGKGGFGAVFEAEELHLQERQAVKVLDPAMVAKEDLLARFRREVSLMRKLVHPRIVRVYDYREDLQQLVALISMELVTGGSVKQLLAAARSKNVEIPIALALEILGQTLEALAEAHTRGVIHRDVTPGNVLLAGGTPDELLAEPGRDPQVKLVDFGIAGLVERSELSQKSRVLGTAAYVAPEVLDPDVEVTPAADVYGAGAMAYELLTGCLPLGRFEEPCGLRAEIDPETNDLVLSLLAARPQKRPGAQAGAWGLRKLREEAARRAAQHEIECRDAAERIAREGREAREAEAARRRQVEAEAKRRQEADKKTAEEQERRRAEAARVTGRPSGPMSSRGEAPRSARKGLSLGAWGGIALALVVLVVAGVWGVSSQRASQERARVEAETQVAVAAEQQRAESDAATERQRQSQLMEQEKQKATKAEPERSTRVQEQATAAESARLEQERRAREDAAQRQREAEAPSPRRREAEAANQRQKEAEARDRSAPAVAWLDERTSLLWTAKDKGSIITWDSAKSHCEGLALGGFSDWQMPSIAELEGLYDASSSKTYKTRGSVELSSYWVWSGDLKDSSDAWLFSFGTGKRLWAPRSDSGAGRALCVRRSEAGGVNGPDFPSREAVAPPQPQSGAQQAPHRDSSDPQGAHSAITNPASQEARDRSQPAGTWRDELLGVLWLERDNGSDISWKSAAVYCANLTLGGSPGWRLPTISELEGLYDASSSKKYKTRGIVQVSSWWVWSGNLRPNDPSTASIYRFSTGKRSWAPLDFSDHYRALCVRRSGT